MDVTAIAPFSSVRCPTCDEKSRVKAEFGHYTLTRRLAEGGMSLVFVAMDNTLGREVALKILNEGYSADETRIAAFEEEARITASFSHPHVVRVFTTGKAYGRLYIAMELVPGGHFERQIRERGKIPEIEILPFAIQVAEGLEAARAAGLIHRDIKPGNILLDAQGNVKIVDFGLALVTKGGSAQAKEIWATPYYVPPETIEGHPEDFRSDLYAFGATLYHALAGKPPCDEQSMATDVLRQAKKHIKALRFAADDVTDETCAIVDKAMAYDRNARFGSYEEMISKLKSALARLKKGTSSVESRKQREEKQKREWIALGAAAALLLAAVTGGLIWILREEPEPQKPKSLAIEVPDVDESADASALIGRRYREARDAVTAGDFAKARSAFRLLRDDDDVQEPTRTWAAVESVVMTFLEGESSRAKEEAEAAIGHIRSTPLAEDPNGKRLLAALERVGDLPLVEPIPPEDSGPDAPWALTTLLGGLKNWEQGLTDSAAADFFRPLMEASFGPKDQWLDSYQKIAGNYLHDHRLLSGPVLSSIPANIRDCEAAATRCDALFGQLKTQGRAGFNVRAFKHELVRQIALLKNPPPAPATNDPMPEASSDPDPVGKFNEFTRACRFAETAEWLKTLKTDPPGTTRESLDTINALAMEFLSSLEADITEASADVLLSLRTGESLAGVKVVEPGKITATPPDGVSREISWGEIDPESMIQLYRNFVRNKGPADPVQIRRHESAIAFDWLTGDRTRAEAAAARLSADNEELKIKWNSLISNLPKP